jgi:hypothetical protein
MYLICGGGNMKYQKQCKEELLKWHGGVVLHGEKILWDAAWEGCENLYETKIKSALEILSGEASAIERIIRVIHILEEGLHGKV